MFQIRFAQLLGALLVAMFIVAACGKQPVTQIPISVVPTTTPTLFPAIEPTITSTAAVPTPTTLPFPPTPFQPGQFPIGIFTKDDVEGHWLLTFKADGSFTSRVNGLFMVRVGIYTLQDDQITLEDDSSVCKGRGKGVYQWIAEGNQITFVVIMDECNSRRITMGNSVWTAMP